VIKGFKSKIMGGSAPNEQKNLAPPQTPQAAPEKHRRLEDRTDPNESVISSQSTFKGEISTQTGARISGELLGNIDSQGLVWVGETGKIKGNVHSPYVILEGELEGDIRSARHVEVRAKAKMRGNIETELLAVADGCVIEGRVNMPSPEAKPVKFSEKRHPDPGRT
jgi:cytoskeletal protein CcmA (bactofilin family)